MDFKDYCIIIPAYNAERTLPIFLDEVEKLHKSIFIYIVDDGSTKKLNFCIDSRPGKMILTHRTNKGKGAALKTGLKQAIKDHYHFALCMDADLQHDPARIIDFINKQQETGADIVLGQRELNSANMPLPRVISNKTTSLIISARIGKPIVDSQCGFRLIKLENLDVDSFQYSGFQFESEFLIRQAEKGSVIEQVKIPTIYNNEKSSINHVMDTLKFIKLLLHSIFWKKQRS